MGTEENRATALKMIKQIGKGIIDESLVTPDVCWWVPGTGTMQKQDFLKLVEGFGNLTKGDCKFVIHGITAEGDRVAVEAESTAKLINGDTYNNTYHFLFQFKNGKIQLAKEYNDSKYASDSFEKLGGLA